MHLGLVSYREALTVQQSLAGAVPASWLSWGCAVSG